jgi:hypothetical protein
MGPAGEASGSQCDRGSPAAGLSRPQAQQASSPNQGQGEPSQSNRTGAVEITTPSSLATIAGTIMVWLLQPA